MEDKIVITTYIAAWCWQILSMIFLSSALVTFSMVLNVKNIIVFVVFMVLFVVCQFKSHSRRGEVYEFNGEHFMQPILTDYQQKVKEEIKNGTKNDDE